MASIFDLLGGSSAPGGNGLLGNMGQGISDNNSAMLGMGLGLLGGQGSADAWSQAMRGFMAGQQQDNVARKLKQEAQERQQKAVWAQSAAKSLGLDPTAAAANPDAVEAVWRTVEANKLTPKEQSFQEKLYNSLPDDQKAAAGQALLGLNKNPAEWEIKTIKNSDGSETPVYFNPRTMETKPVPGFGTGQSRADQAAQQARQSADIVVQDIDRALDKTNNGDVKILGFDTGLNKVTGAVGQAMSKVGGTEANDVSSLLDTIKANATFDKLQQMRKSSPTGAALGAVSDTENKLLGAAIGSLEQSQTKEQFVYNLKRVKKIYNGIIHGPDAVDDDGNPKGGSAALAVGGSRDLGGGVTVRRVR
jgi:hypothetical protein